jgi:hypothetical protein
MWNGAGQLDESAISTTTTTTTTEHVQATAASSSSQGSLENLFHWQDTVMKEVGRSGDGHEGGG